MNQGKKLNLGVAQDFRYYHESRISVDGTVASRSATIIFA